MTQTQEAMFCKCGCGKITSIAKVVNRKRGYAAGLPFKYFKGHRGKPIEDYIIPEPNSGCHLWIGASDTNGYGTKSRFGKRWSAHRLVYEMEHGEIPKGLTVDHLCRVRSCVNTRHMEIVTQKENNLRGFSPVALNFKKKFCPKCLGTYTERKNNRRICVNCNRISERNRYAIKKQLGGQLAMVLK